MDTRSAHRLNLTLLVCLCLLAACSSTTGPNYLRGSLANNGPVMMSRDNPYIVGNLFLSNELSLSPVMDGFIKHRGTPDALEVTKRWMKPLRIYFFYFDRQDAYLFEQGPQDWIIRGPQRIPEELLARFSSTKSRGNVPLLHRSLTESDVVVDDSGAPEQADESAPASLPPAVKKPESRPTKETKAPTVKKPKNSPVPSQAAAEEDQDAAWQSEGFPSDLVHTVKYPRETLRMIAAWYTDSPGNAGRIARMNGIENPNRLEMNQQIRIPGYLLKRAEPLSEPEVRRYLSERAGQGS